MIVKKKSLGDVPREEAHGGAGGRRLYIKPGELQNVDWEAMTYGYLPAGAAFDWHFHRDIDEAMMVIKGEGKVFDNDGEYTYAPGDLFIFPANQEHRILNCSTEEHEFLFVRIHTRF